MSTFTTVEAEEAVRSHFKLAGVEPLSVEARSYPEESIIIVRVARESNARANELANAVDRELAELGFSGFVTVRTLDEPRRKAGALKKGVFDPRALELANLLSARSRTSEAQPSLTYIRDAADSLSSAVARRNHLVFGRRGSGKTALMVEAKRQIAERGHLSVWMNLQTLRHFSAEQGFLWFLEEMGAVVQAHYARSSRVSHILTEFTSLRESAQKQLASSHTPDVHLLVPKTQRAIRRFLEAESQTLYVFVDEVHYLQRDFQPYLLDHLHGALRDADAWLKVAGIKNLMRWFQSSPPTGLQTGQDADHINLDITLENPAAAKEFLEEMLLSYASHVGIQAIRSVFSPEALDRLILASGAVPRDYLTLAAAAIREAQKRQKARTVGVQDINRVAGDAAKVKVAELEDDAESAGQASRIAVALRVIREYCIATSGSTYFRIDFRDKEQHQAEYSLLQDLVDLRLLHLLDSSLSDEHEAGRRSEVYVLDLSQYSGQRLKKKLKVLDFEQGKLVLKETGTGTLRKIATTPRQRVTLLRRGPQFDLQLLDGQRQISFESMAR